MTSRLRIYRNPDERARVTHNESKTFFVINIESFQSESRVCRVRLRVSALSQRSAFRKNVIFVASVSLFCAYSEDPVFNRLKPTFVSGNRAFCRSSFFGIVYHCFIATVKLALFYFALQCSFFHRTAFLPQLF